jgi:hypothetical protein
VEKTNLKTNRAMLLKIQEVKKMDCTLRSRFRSSSVPLAAVKLSCKISARLPRIESLLYRIHATRAGTVSGGGTPGVAGVANPFLALEHLINSRGFSENSMSRLPFPSGACRVRPQSCPA